MNTEDRTMPVQVFEKTPTAVSDRIAMTAETMSETAQARRKPRLNASRRASSGWNIEDHDLSLAARSIEAGNAMDPKKSSRYAQTEDRFLSALSGMTGIPGDDNTRKKYPGRTEAAAKTRNKMPSLKRVQKSAHPGRPGLASMTCPIVAKT
jgi:hypothetical protein